MENTWDYCEYRIGAHFLSALINNDYTGLDDKEEDTLRFFIRQVQKQWGIGHWSVSDVGEEFAMCMASNKLATVETVVYNFRVD